MEKDPLERLRNIQPPRPPGWVDSSNAGDPNKAAEQHKEDEPGRSKAVSDEPTLPPPPPPPPRRELRGKGVQGNKNIGGQQQRMRRKGPTPYEVWAAKNDFWGQESKQQHFGKRMKEKDWDRLFKAMDELEHVRKREVQHQRYRSLADQLQGLPFRPELNEYSLQLASGKKALTERQRELVQIREDHLRQQREQKLREEMEECTFTPKLCSLGKSHRYLRIAAKAGRKLDFDEYMRQGNLRRQQRRKALDEAEALELTFTPRLTKMSAHILKKAKKQRRIQVNRATGQTTVAAAVGDSRKAGSSRRALYTGEEESERFATFEPSITLRSSRYSPGKPVHARLYESAMAASVKNHNDMVLAMKQSLRNCATRRFETTEAMKGTKAAWVSELHSARTARKAQAEQALLRASEEPVLTVITYEKRYDNLFAPFSTEC